MNKWISHLLILLAGLASADVASAYELELIFYRAPTPLDWSTPGSLVRGSYQNIGAKVKQVFRNDQSEGNVQQDLKQVIYPHSISHVNVKVQCGAAPAVYSGMTGTKSSFDYGWDLVIEGMGLDTLLVPTAGRYVRQKDVLAMLPLLEEQGYIRKLKLKLNPAQCGALQNYMSIYDQYGLARVYGGLRSDPLLGQGAGCSAFGVSFLRVLNALEPDFQKYWKRQLNLPMRLLSSDSRTADFGFVSYLRGINERWAVPGEDQVRVDFWDPERMFNWVENVITGQTQFAHDLWIEDDIENRPITVVWDISDRPQPSKWPFLLPPKQLEMNARFHFENRDLMYTKEHLRNENIHECREFGVCGPVVH